MEDKKLQNLTISSATITIKVVRVDKHKMTKATFKQIQERHIPIRELINMGKNNILGWVLDYNNWQKKYCLYSYNGKLFRSDIGGPGEKNFTDRFDQLFIAT